ncbi:hypothetical protein AB0P15_29655 [Streptomyces sp. NPDC087917]|uniref:hypothetical protein n=1 Tax=Streptomyces sp. NPDC087917 TaxID=3155060 RepID=UPI00341A1C96
MRAPRVHVQVLGDLAVVTFCGSAGRRDEGEVRTALGALPPGVSSIVLDLAHGPRARSPLVDVVRAYARDRSWCVAVIVGRRHPWNAEPSGVDTWIPLPTGRSDDTDVRDDVRAVLSARMLGSRAQGIRWGRRRAHPCRPG